MCLLDNFAKKGEVRPTFPLMFVPEVLYEFVVEKWAQVAAQWSKIKNLIKKLFAKK